MQELYLYRDDTLYVVNRYCRIRENRGNLPVRRIEKLSHTEYWKRDSMRWIRWAVDIERALAQCDAISLRMLLVRAVTGMTYRRMANWFHCSEQTIRRHLRRALDKLTQILFRAQSDSRIYLSGVPGGSPTRNPRLRRPVLYAVELQGHALIIAQFSLSAEKCCSKLKRSILSMKHFSLCNLLDGKQLGNVDAEKLDYTGGDGVVTAVFRDTGNQICALVTLQPGMIIRVTS